MCTRANLYDYSFALHARKTQYRLQRRMPMPILKNAPEPLIVINQNNLDYRNCHGDRK